MFTKDDILARLQNGDSMDAIAKEMSEVLNAANAQYQEETIKANAEKLEAARVLEAKREAVMMMLSGLCDYCAAAGKEDLIEELRDVDVDETITSMDSLLELVGTLMNLGNVEFKIPEVKESDKCGSSSKACKSGAFDGLRQNEMDSIIMALFG